MGVSDVEFEANTGSVVDHSDQGLQKLDANFVCSDDTHTLVLDRNHIMKLDHLERSPGLQQLSVAANRLVRMMGVSRLTQLQVLNLPNNSIGYIEGLRDLVHLRWLNLSGNNIKAIEQLHNCTSIEHLDLSDNNISSIGDLTKLVALKTLLLHGNGISTLRTVPAHVPAQLSILSLAENEIRDLNEVSYLAPLHELEQLSIMSNPCVMETPSLPGFDYRPYITSWCLSLKVLDGYVVSQKEGLKAEWLYSQGKGRLYRPGQHVQLVQYLAMVCPLTSSLALEKAEDAKLEKILSKQRMHQRQLLEESQVSSPSPPRPTQLDVERHSPSSAVPPGGAREMKKITSPAPAAAPSIRETEPVVQFNTWVNPDSSHPSVPFSHSPRITDEHMYLEAVQTDEDKLNGSMLSSESTFLSFTYDLEPQPSHSDSEDETETFEPDSLAPKRPAQPKKHSADETHHSPVVMERQRVTVEQDDCSVSNHNRCTATTSGSVGVRVSTPQNDPETSTDCTKVEMKEDGKHGGVVPGATKSSLKDANTAAIKIQSWWRGQYTRCCHPRAREVRSEIRLRRMHEHIVFLSGELGRVQKQCEEERLHRQLQEEAVKFLWNQVQSMQQWQQSVELQLVSMNQAVVPPQTSAPVPCKPAPPAVSNTTEAACTGTSFPDSGFESTMEQQPTQEDSFFSNGTTDSLKTVRALSPVFSSCAGGGESPDCSLLDQYLSSVQLRDEEEAEEGIASDRTQSPSPWSPRETAQSNTPLQNIAHNQSDVAGTPGASPGPV
ncbi:centrosomal protein of 97 kDa [Genypterus blacodes]|uniref:centrosomal protein of 97 kDa n=1 Tax=Genypterus blacodes TaxID=154954 RepID=UPI003F7655D1